MIKTELDYQRALTRIDEIMGVARRGTAHGDEFELLIKLVEIYEEEHDPIENPDPIEAIRFRMEQQGLSPSDLVKYIGSRSKVSEVLNRKRPLSLAMIRSLHRGLGVPAEVLLGSISPRRRARPRVKRSVPRVR